MPSFSNLYCKPVRCHVEPQSTQLTLAFSPQQEGLEAAVEVVLEVAGEDDDEGGSGPHLNHHFVGPGEPGGNHRHHHHHHHPLQIAQHPNAPRGYRRSRRGSQFYACPYCKKQFLDKSKWSRHLLAHTGEKPFLCNVCSRGFSRKDNLQTHLKDKHRIFSRVIC